MTENLPIPVPAPRLITAVADIFARLGLPQAAAYQVAEDLVAADLSGAASHGVMLLPMYVERIRSGSVTLATAGRVVSERGGAIVLDAENALGQLTARQAVDLATSRAKVHGLAAVSVRNAFHFGAAGLYARLMAEQGCIGFVMSNTRPLMPAPGGAEAIVGNNPLAVAAPSADGATLVVDMAMSATAMGKIRLAAAAGQPIAPGWAVDAEGAPTTDAATAIKGMLLPAAGPKGFGLAFLIDLLCGGLSAGAVGGHVRPLYGDPAQPYASAQFFLALDVAHFGDLHAFEEVARAQAERVRNSRPAAGVERIFAPGDRSRAATAANGEMCKVAPETLRALAKVAQSLGADLRDLIPDDAGLDRS